MCHVMCHHVLLAHGHLMVVTFVIRLCIVNNRVHILSLDMIGCGMMWQSILLCSHGIHVHLGLITEVWYMAHFWVSYGRCTMPGSPMGRSKGSSRRWTG